MDCNGCNDCSGHCLVNTPVVAIDRVATASGFLNTFIVAQLGVVVGFMGATALSKTKLKG